MSINIKSEKINGYYIYIELGKNGVYKVAACPIVTEDFCGYPLTELFYTTEKDAKRGFYYLKRKYGGK